MRRAAIACTFEGQIITESRYFSRKSLENHQTESGTKIALRSMCLGRAYQVPPLPASLDDSIVAAPTESFLAVNERM